MALRTAVLSLLACTCLLASHAQQLPTLGSPSSGVRSPAPGPSYGVSSANTTGSIGALCSSQGGILSALQGVVSNSNAARFNVSIPSALSDANSLSQTALIAWHYIVTYPLPFIAKTLAGVSQNATLINTFSSSSQTLSNYTTTTIAGGVTPNYDTLYNQAFLDLSQGPVVVTVPSFDTPRRYWIVPFQDSYLNLYGAIGSAYNSSAGRYLVVGRNTPRGTSFTGFTSDRIFYSPTDINWVIGRVLVLNSSDEATAYSFSRQFNITPYFPTGPVNASGKAATIARSVNGSGYGTYFNSLGFLDRFTTQAQQWFNVSANYITTDPPANGSATQLISNLQSLVQQASDPNSNGLFTLANQVAKQCILTGDTGYITNTGWTSHTTTTGVYDPSGGYDYLQRAQETQFIPAALPANQVIYYLSRSFYINTPPYDSSTGTNYTITVQLPIPAASFWSLIIYNGTQSNLGLFQSATNRYSISDRTTGLVYSGTNNNTINVFVSATAPPNGTVQYANWLPAPTNAPFVFILRTYLPPASSIAGQYVPASVDIAPSTTFTPLTSLASAG